MSILLVDKTVAKRSIVGTTKLFGFEIDFVAGPFASMTSIEFSHQYDWLLELSKALYAKTSRTTYHHRAQCWKKYAIDNCFVEQLVV